ncbi:Transposase [Pseudovibrio sp. FO-BEG1]|nr:Transposase [Pseudovibrio sp. FO-BEG1]
MKTTFDLDALPRLKDYRFPRSIVGYTVWACHRFALSLRDVEALRSGLAAARLIQLDWWARDGAVRAVYAAVAGQRFQQGAAAFALIKPLAGIGGHHFGFAVAAIRASHCAFKHNCFGHGITSG